MPGSAFDGSEDLPNDLDPHLSLTGAALMKDQMQYIVIEGRKPQDGAKPTRALLILPKWISPTLACAGIVGRVIELTDGNIIEQGAVFMGEQETLESLRIDISQDAESQQEEVSPTAIDPNATQPADDFDSSRAEAMEPTPVGEFHYSQQWELLNSLTEQFGRPASSACLEWLRIELTDLERGRTVPPPAVEAAVPITKDREFINRLCLEFGAQLGDTWQEWLREQLEELAQFRLDRPETLAKLQAAEDNLDDNLNTLCAAYGCLPGQDRLAWVHTKLNALIEAESNLSETNSAHDNLEIQLQDLRAALNQIRKSAKRALQ